MHALAARIAISSPRTQCLLLVGFFLAAGMLLYGRSLRYEFVELDDALLIYENPKIQGYTLRNMKQIFTTYDPELYVPATLLSYQFDYAIGGADPFVYRVHNLLLHVANAVLVAILASLFLRRRWAAVFCGLLFLAHPLQSEAVVWASARKDTLSTLYFLVSVVTYVLAARGGGRWMYPVSVAAFALGLMSKVAIIPLPIALFLFDYLDRRALRGRMLANKLPFFALSLIFGVVALYGKAHVVRPPPHDLLLMWIKSVALFLQKAVWPTGLSILYPFLGSITLRSPAFWVPALVLLALLAVIAVAWRTDRRTVAAGLSFFLLILAPSLFNLAKFPDYYVTSDRYAYVALVGLFLVVGAGLLSLDNHVRASAGQIRQIGQIWQTGPYLIALFSFIALFALGVTTYRHLPVWRDHEALSLHVLSLYPQSRIAHMDLGNALRDRGAFAEAHASYDASLAIREDELVYYNKALLLEMEGKPDEALTLYERAVAMAPFYDLAVINLGRLYYAQGRRADAAAMFEKAAAHAPHLAMPRFNLGVIAAEEKRFPEAERRYREAIEAEPRFADARVNLIVLLLDQGRTEEAVTELRSALRAIPGDPRFERMRVALGR